MLESNNPDLKNIPLVVNEGSVTIETSRSFYNPHMRFCRTLYTLAFEALPEKALSVLDGFAATGIRGLRYAKECGKKVELVLLDVDDNLKSVIEGNAERNNIVATIVTGEFNKYVRTCARRFDYVEIDPFGSPLPFLDSGIYSIGKRGYLSVTATDTQVLCGANSSACKRYYGSRPLNNYACHEIGLRILIATIARKAAEQNKGITPLLSVARRHYMKVLCSVAHGSKKADDSLSKIWFFKICQACLFHEKYEFGELLSCKVCGKRTIVVGPLWLGNLHTATLLEAVESLVLSKEYFSESEKKELLSAIEHYKCDDFSVLFYDIHEFCKACKLQLKPNKAVISFLRGRGFKAGVCSFSSKGIKGDFSYDDFISAIKS